MSYTGCYNICNQRYRNGTYHYGSSGNVQPDDLSSDENSFRTASRMPAFIVVVASFVTIVQMLLQGFIPSLYSALGIYIPLIVVNCIILGRAEAYASKNPPVPSLFDGIGMGLGFTVSITCIGAVRELIGAGAALRTADSSRWPLTAGKWRLSAGHHLCPCTRRILRTCHALAATPEQIQESVQQSAESIQVNSGSGCGGRL